MKITEAVLERDRARDEVKALRRQLREAKNANSELQASLDGMEAEREALMLSRPQMDLRKCPLPPISSPAVRGLSWRTRPDALSGSHGLPQRRPPQKQQVLVSHFPPSSRSKPTFSHTELGRL